MIKSGLKKEPKPVLEPQTTAAKHAYVAEQMEKAMAKLEEYKRLGDEKGIKRTTEIIQNLKGMESRLR